MLQNSSSSYNKNKGEKKQFSKPRRTKICFEEMLMINRIVEKNITLLYGHFCTSYWGSVGHSCAGNGNRVQPMLVVLHDLKV